MKRTFLTLLACVLLDAGVSAQNNSDKQSSTAPQRAAQEQEALSPDLLEAQKLRAEVVKLYNAEKYEEATPLAKRVLQIREKALAPGHRLIVESLLDVGELYRARQKFGEAKDYYRRLLSLYEQSPAPEDRVAMAKVLDRLGFLNYMQFNFDEAEQSFQRALALREQTSGAESLEAAMSLFTLAEFYRLKGSYTKAEPLYQKAIGIKGNALGPENQDVVRSLERYSCLYYAMDQREKLKDIRKQFSFLREQDAAIVNQGEILNGKAVSLPKPVYPSAAKERGVSGIVIIKVKIDETGKVIEAADMCAAPPLLVGTSLQAASQALFTPTLVRGVPVKVTGVIFYKFIAR